MRVLYVVKASPLGTAGGGEKRAAEVTDRLADRGHQVTLLCGKTDPGLERRTTANGCEVRHVTIVPDWLLGRSTVGFYATRYLFAFASLPVLVRLLFDREFDVLVENMAPYPTLAVLVAKAASVPIVAVQHEFFGRDAFETYDPLTAVVQLTVQNLLRLADYDALVVPTAHVSARFDDYGVPADRIRVVHNGIDADRYDRPEVGDRPRRLVTVGRLCKRKGQATLLRAFARVHDRLPRTRLHVVGTGPARQRLEALAEDLGVGEAVTFHGFVSEAEKVRLLNASGVFLSGSSKEGFGLVLLEAMAAGLPVVARRLPVYEAFFEDGTNGRLLRDASPEAFAATVVDLLSDPDRRREIGETNRRTARRYSWDETAARTEAILRDVVA